MKFETIAVRAGSEADPSTGAVCPPIHLSTTFEHGPESQNLHGFTYIRSGNPTQARLEDALCKLEGGSQSLAFASGIAAAACFLQNLPRGSHVLFPEEIYMNMRTLAQELFPLWGLEHSSADMRDPARVQMALRKNTKLLWIETPSNPRLSLTDIAALAQVARKAGAEVLVDNTFATPVHQRPLELGADVVLHSTTKYFGGHSDVQGGALILKTKSDRLESLRSLNGAVASPFNSYLVLRGLRSLVCRMERHSANAARVAEALQGLARVEVVYYPGCPAHPGHAIARQQMHGGFGGVLSFEVKGGRAAAVAVASKLRLFINATSLGGTESLVEHRASMEGVGSPTPEGLLRLSVGLEHPDDLIEDLRQALV
jgi:cystathionine gamma-synthase